mmetsp:Transcript_11750/g.35823  ORF Transcript_11750/g.35823 Transcript_11750/m.35823 type:complete len:238 (-) Transcript_11750:417-1130(-)
MLVKVKVLQHNGSYQRGGSADHHRTGENIYEIYNRHIPDRTVLSNHLRKCMIQHNGNSVVHNTFAKHQIVKLSIDLQRIEYCQRRHRVHCRYKRSEGQGLPEPKRIGQTYLACSVKCKPKDQSCNNSAKDGKDDDTSGLFEKISFVERIASFEDNGGDDEKEKLLLVGQRISSGRGNLCQTQCGSNYYANEDVAETVRYCRDRVLRDQKRRNYTHGKSQDEHSEPEAELVFFVLHLC